GDDHELHAVDRKHLVRLAEERLFRHRMGDVAVHPREIRKAQRPAQLRDVRQILVVEDAEIVLHVVHARDRRIARLGIIMVDAHRAAEVRQQDVRVLLKRQTAPVPGHLRQADPAARAERPVQMLGDDETDAEKLLHGIPLPFQRFTGSDEIQIQTGRGYKNPYPINRRSFGKRYGSSCWRPPMLNRNETNPMRPMNMNIMMMILLGALRSSVIPVDRPHVPNALVTSNMMSIRSKRLSSSTVIDTMPENTSTTASIMTANARCRSSRAISRLKMFTRSRPRLNAMRNSMTSASVVVRMPPPAELGLAPMNMSPLMTTCVPSANSAGSTVVSPPLLVVEDAKKLFESVLNHASSLK